jgi:hypothetical protein
MCGWLCRCGSRSVGLTTCAGPATRRWPARVHRPAWLPVRAAQRSPPLLPPGLGKIYGDGGDGWGCEGAATVGRRDGGGCNIPDV